MTSKKYLNTFLASTVAASMVTPQIANAQSAKFNDIDKSYAKQNIEYLAKKGIVDGVGGSKFEPSEVMNRESFAALLGKTLKIKEKASGSSFKDVSPWAQGVVGALEEKQLVSGLGKGYFGAKMPVTREQMAVFYVRALGYEEEAQALNLPLKYKDANDVSQWAKPLVAFAEEIGFIKGYPDGTFKPQKEALREDVAALSYRFIDPENTDPELSGGTVRENRYIEKANEIIQKETAPLTIESNDITKENVANYLVKGTAKENATLQITISYEEADGSVGVRSKTATANAQGNYEKSFDLTSVPNGKVTINVGYWTTDGSSPKTVEKEVTKNVEEIKEPENPENPENPNPDTPEVVIETIKPLNDIVIEQGGSYELPNEVDVVYSDGQEKKIAVAWDTSKIDVNTVGTYAVDGTVEGTSLKASINIVVNIKAIAVNSIKTVNPTDIDITLNRELVEEEKLSFVFDGVAIDTSKVTFNKEVVSIKVPDMVDEQTYELIVKKEDGTEIYKESIKFDLKAPSKIETVPVGYAKQVGEKVQVKYVIFDEDNEPLEGARVRIQVQYYDSVDLETKVIEEVVTSKANGEIVYEYTSLDARRDVVNAISVDNPANVRNEGNITVDWSFAKTGLIEVDVPQDGEKGEGTYRKYTVTFKDENGNPLPKNTKVFVYLGEQASSTTKIKPGTDFTKVLGDPQYAEAVIGNFQGKAVLEVTDIAGKTVKPLFYYDLNNDNIHSYLEEPNDPRVQAGATMYKKQVPNFTLSEKKQGNIPVGDTRVIQLTAIDQFGDPYLGIVRVGLEQAMDNLNETKYGNIKFDIDVNRDGDALDTGIGEYEDQTGKAASEEFHPGVAINFADRIKNGDIERSIVDLIVKDGLDLETADVVAFVDQNNNGYDASDYQVKKPVKFEDLYIKNIDVTAQNTRIAEGNTTYFTVAFKDQNGKPIELSASRASDLAFQVLDEDGKVISDYNNSKNAISLETDYQSHVEKRADYAEGTDYGHTLSYDTQTSYEKFVVKFTSDTAGKYTLRVFLDDHTVYTTDVDGSGTPGYIADQKKQDDEISTEVSIFVDGPVLTSGEVTTSAKYSTDTTKEMFTYFLRDQDRQAFKSKEDLTVDYKVTNTGTTAATIRDEENRTYVIEPGQTIDIEELIELSDNDYVLEATPNAKGDVTLVVHAQVRNFPQSASTSEITWAPVKIDETLVSGTDEKIYTGTVVSFQRTDETGTGNGWYVIKTSVGNVKIEYVKTDDTFIVDQNTDNTGVAFDEQLTVGDQVSWEYDGAGKEKHNLNNK